GSRIMIMTRRAFLGAAAAAAPALAAAADQRARLGIVIHSFGIRAGAERGRDGQSGFSDPLVFLEHCRQLGAGGVQVPMGTRPAAYTAKLREQLETHGLYLEGSIRIPKDQGDVD